MDMPAIFRNRVKQSTVAKTDTQILMPSVALRGSDGCPALDGQRAAFFVDEMGTCRCPDCCSLKNSGRTIGVDNVPLNTPFAFEIIQRAWPIPRKQLR